LQEIRKCLDILASKAPSLPPSVLSGLSGISQNFTEYNFKAALAGHVALTTSHWSDHKDWLKGLKYMIQLAQKKLQR
jgi:hypothetical protein